MKVIYLLLFAALLPAGCGSKPAPAWLTTSHKQIETYKQDFLSARNPAVAELRFKKAETEIKRTGDLDLLGKALLTRMALRVAVLEAADADDYLKVESAQPVPANRNFYFFLRGDTAEVNEALLPTQYRPFLASLRTGDAGKIGKAITAIEDPLSLLIASGIASVHNVETESILLAAVDAASHNGWKKALLAWLKRLENFYVTADDAARADSVRRRIAIVEK